MVARSDRDYRDDSVRCDVDLRQRSREVWAPLADRFWLLSGVSGVVPDDTPDRAHGAADAVGLPAGQSAQPVAERRTENIFEPDGIA
ncbi:Uncharacterised protein [Mycobacteroides abscessus]|nr:Uncharacterised protein [Mycobacteroides abscessus]